MEEPQCTWLVSASDLMHFKHSECRLQASGPENLCDNEI